MTLWGTLMGGGAGVEYYFGYQFAENDLNCEDWRSRDRSWDYCRLALTFFREQRIPIQDIEPADELVGNPEHDNSRYCLAKSGEIYLVYLPQGGSTELDLTGAGGSYHVSWYNPRSGGKLQTGKVKSVTGGQKVRIEAPGDDQEDWLGFVRSAP